MLVSSLTMYVYMYVYTTILQNRQIEGKDGEGGINTKYFMFPNHSFQPYNAKVITLFKTL